MNKRLRYVLPAAAVMVLLIAVFSCRQTWYVEYADDGLIVAGTWGAEDGQFGRRATAGGEWFGPQAYAVHPNGEWVAIADTHNQRVIIAGPDRQPQIVPVDDGPLAVAVAGGSVIVLTADKMGLLDPAAGAVRPFDSPPLEPGQQAHRIQMGLTSSPYGVVLTEVVLFPDSLRRRQFSIIFDDPPVLFSLGELTVGSDGSRSVAGNVGSSMAAGPHGVIVDSPAGDGVRELCHRGQVARVACSPATKAAAIVGVDSRGMIYMEFELLGGDRELARFDGRGKDIAPAQWTITLQPQPVTIAGMFQVDIAGRVYVATADDEGYRIVRYKPVRRR